MKVRTLPLDLWPGAAEEPCFLLEDSTTSSSEWRHLSGSVWYSYMTPGWDLHSPHVFDRLDDPEQTAGWNLWPWSYKEEELNILQTLMLLRVLLGGQNRILTHGCHFVIRMNKWKQIVLFVNPVVSHWTQMASVTANIIVSHLCM